MNQPLLFGRLSGRATTPTRAHDTDAGLDLFTTEDIYLQPGERYLAATGVAVAIPAGFVGYVVPRSGHANRIGLSIVNAPGTIDAGYRGEVKVNLINLDRFEAIDLPAGSRIAQLVLHPIVTPAAILVEPAELPDAERGDAGHGSTGA